MRHHHNRPEIDAIMRELFAVDSLEYLDLFRAIVITARLLKYLAGEHRSEGALSSARIRLLTHLSVAAQLERPDGLPPSELSRYLDVSRNTISALLNGLEEQGLVERRLHPTDRRQFLIRITPAGDALVRERSPAFARRLADLLSVLSPDERATLHDLLHKLGEHLASQSEAQDLFSPKPAQPGLDGD